MSDTRIFACGITYQQVADTISTAFESGSAYWIDVLTPVMPLGLVEKLDNPWYADPALLDHPFHFIVRPNDWDDDEELPILDRDTLREACELLREKHSDFYEAMRYRELDAEGADVFFQLAFFKEIVYG